MATAEPYRHHQSSEHADSAFEKLAEPFRREIKLHCYRMLGSLHEADDLVQETYLRAWRSFSSFEASTSDERGSFRAWLYRIATNACINALEGRKHHQRYLPDQLGGSTASINSALQRARETLSHRYSNRQPPLESQTTAAQQRLLGRYLQAWEGHDVDGFVAVLKQDATAVMPPWLQWFIGRDVIGTFFAAAWKTCGGLRLVPTAANGQPAFAVYERTGANGLFAAHSIHVLTIEDDIISTMTLFVPPTGPGLFHAFGLPLTLPGPASAELPSTPHHS